MPEPTITPLAQALWDYHERRPDQTTPTSFTQRGKPKLFVHCDRATRERQDPSVYYGPYDPAHAHPAEQLAFSLCRGRVLDVGAGAGRHALYLSTGPMALDVTALEQDSALCALMRARGVPQVIETDWQAYRAPAPGYDTVIAMMNGAGLCGSIDKLPAYLSWLGDQLALGGHILLDTSTVDYLPPPPPERGSHRGHVMFRFEYAGRRGEWFPWLFLSARELIQCLEDAGLEGRLLGPGKGEDRVLVQVYRQGSARS